MRLGLNTGYSGATIQLPMALIREADRLGYYAVWTAEAYGSDAVSPLAWIGAQTGQIHLGTAILQMAARSPAMTAMTAMTLDQLSGGRMLLGLGVSGPQVVEGWHGVGYARPLARTREYIEIVRRIFARAEPLTFDGEFYQLPYSGAWRVGAGQTAEKHPARAGGSADLPGCHRPAECAVGRRTGRWLAADFLRAAVLPRDIRRSGCSRAGAGRQNRRPVPTRTSVGTGPPGRTTAAAGPVRHCAVRGSRAGG